jgi:hypothetical protein
MAPRNNIAIFFDFAKAFDIVDHERLLLKIEKMLPQWLIKWIANWLQGRKQRVIYRGKQTRWRNVLAGVVQGSVLGPILFLLFILDINDYLPIGVDLLNYAGDILAYIIGNTATNLAQNVVDAVQRWCDDNMMRLNVAKCKVIVINPSSNRFTGLVIPSLMLLGQGLEFVNSYKYLGFEISFTLDMGLQWTRVRAAVSPVEYLLKQLKLNGWSQPMLLAAYRAYF